MRLVLNAGIRACESTTSLRDRLNTARHPHHGAMGIRYYAYPITAEQYDDAAKSPCRFHGSDPLMDAWGPKEEQPEMLYLDKCWHELQVLFSTEPGVPDRAALRLVEGQVTHVEMGWIPHERALSPAEVAAIASDLATIGEADIRRSLPQLNRWHETPEQVYSYVAHFLTAAQEFTARLAADGRGLVYLIG